MSHKRRLALSSVSLTMVRSNRHTISVGTEVRDELENVLISMGFFENAPFKWIGLMLRFGLKNDTEPKYDKIDDADGELPVAIELDTNDLQNATREELKRFFKVATLKALIHIAKQYDLHSENLIELLREIGNIGEYRNIEGNNIHNIEDIEGHDTGFDKLRK
jgi:hypothetical protein